MRDGHRHLPTFVFGQEFFLWNEWIGFSQCCVVKLYNGNIKIKMWLKRTVLSQITFNLWSFLHTLVRWQLWVSACTCACVWASKWVQILNGCLITEYIIIYMLWYSEVVWMFERIRERISFCVFNWKKKNRRINLKIF